MPGRSHSTPEQSLSRLGKLALQCVHCGFCLPACPTYELIGTEMDSPRGRIILMQAAAQGEIALNIPALTQHLSRCLECRACESACPSQVQYSKMVDLARPAMSEQRRQGVSERLIRWLALKQLFPHPERIKRLAGLLWFYQACGLQSLLRRFRLLPHRLAEMEALLPPLHRPEHSNSKAGEKSARDDRQVTFFTGCLHDSLLPEVNKATIAVLEKAGWSVRIPAEQVCCGALHEHLGDLEGAKSLARNNIEAFIASSPRPIINNAGGCGAMLKEYGELLGDDPDWAEEARRFSARVFDINEFLVKAGCPPPSGRLPLKVSYADSCHLRHGQGIINEPRRLLQAIPGLTYIELEEAEQCCGSAGVYNLLQPDIAAEILERKVQHILHTGADVLAVTNTGCYMQLLKGLRQKGSSMKVLHVAEVLAMADQAGEVEDDSRS